VDGTSTHEELSQSWLGAKHLAVLGAYEDSSAGARVYEFCRRLSKVLGQDCEIKKIACPFNEFCIPDLRAKAANEAALSDLIIISANQADSFPAEVRSWIEMWLGQGESRPKVLVALFDAVYRGNEGPLRAYLQCVAERGQMKLVVQEEEANSLGS
jgi:hypothetical protein